MIWLFIFFLIVLLFCLIIMLKQQAHKLYEENISIETLEENIDATTSLYTSNLLKNIFARDCLKIDSKLKIKTNNIFDMFLDIKTTPELEIYNTSVLFTGLKSMQPVGMDTISLKKFIIKLLQTQNENGACADCISADKFVISYEPLSSAMLVLLVANYINYSGDIEFLSKKYSYAQNQASEGKICIPDLTDKKESVYNHCISALNYCKENLNHESLLYTSRSKQILDLGLDEDYSAYASFLFSLACEKFIPFVNESDERKTLLIFMTEIKSAMLNKYKNNSKKLINQAIIYLCSHAGNLHDLAEKLYSDSLLNLETNGLKYYHLAIISVFYIMGNFNLADKFLINCTEDFIKNQKNEHYTETLKSMLKSLIIGGFYGVKFSCGHMSFKQKKDSFVISFKHIDKQVLADFSSLNNGIKVNGLRINSLDYINLKGYNKDIHIEIGVAI